MEKIKVQFSFDKENFAIHEIEGISQSQILREIAEHSDWYFVNGNEAAINLKLVTKITFPVPAKLKVGKSLSR